MPHSEEGPSILQRKTWAKWSQGSFRRKKKVLSAVEAEEFGSQGDGVLSQLDDRVLAQMGACPKYRV